MSVAGGSAGPGGREGAAAGPGPLPAGQVGSCAAVAVGPFRPRLSPPPRVGQRVPGAAPRPVSMAIAGRPRRQRGRFTGPGAGWLPPPVLSGPQGECKVNGATRARPGPAASPGPAGLRLCGLRSLSKRGGRPAGRRAGGRGP